VKIAILNIDTLKDEFVRDFGDYPAMFNNQLHKVDPSIETIAYETHLGEYPQDINEVDAYIITGSKLSVYDDVPWINELKEFICILHAQKKKLIGICFGHQLVAEALGGKTRKADIGWCVGVHTNTLNEHAKAYGIDDVSFSIQSSHQDQVYVPPEGAIILASSERCPNAMMAVDNHILSIQGHIEFTLEYAEALIEMRRTIFGELIYNSAKASLEQHTDQDKVTRWIIDFIAK
jgi:GMP synthase-like glutamine amidotransferase